MTGRRPPAGLVLPLATIVLALGAARWRLRLVTVTSGSMEPSIQVGDRLLVRRCSPRAVRVGDVVLALLPPANYETQVRASGDADAPTSTRDSLPDPSHRVPGPGAHPPHDLPDQFVKRVVAMPGQSLSRDGLLTMLAPGRRVPTDLPDGWTIPPHSCFVLGDGIESADSVTWGPLPLPLVIGRAVAHRSARTSAWSRVPASPWRHG